MFVGHFAAAMIAKKVAPATSLGMLFAAAQWLDLVWPVLLLAGVEQAEIAHSADAAIALTFTHYPYSHSLLAVFIWAVAGGAFWWWRTRSLRASLVVAGLVASHWLLDLLVHIPDLPLVFDGGPHLGLGLWQWPLLALSLELGLLFVGVTVYRRRIAHPGGARPWALYGLVAFLVVIQFANTFGPPPPSISAVAWTGLATWMLVAWGWWVDRAQAVNGDQKARKSGCKGCWVQS